VMKGITKDSSVFFSQFVDADGQMNHEKFYTFMLKAQNFDKAVAVSFVQGGESRAVAIEKALKNTNFKPSETASAGQGFASDEDALRAAMRKQKF
jgi:hypothetical protein